ncbi:pyridoxamine 5'-phosphate oxidase family protein [Streptomyces rimosus]|uniref:pyridoxamine 5'-phosphate oxidase family protein n=1 Tax=Streptomyces rimosus TaxID=1927 RepID=UPI000AB7E7C7|nr:pyridoxamine 5'-phosphate oxidase family protein [Streptomyces rimosus]
MPAEAAGWPGGDPPDGGVQGRPDDARQALRRRSAAHPPHQPPLSEPSSEVILPNQLLPPLTPLPPQRELADHRPLPRLRHTVPRPSTSDAQGNCDVSPRGGLPGFTHVLDATTPALPDRPGNRRADTFHNVLENPHAGLLYLIPGSKDALRINGRARVLTDAPFFDAMTVRGQRPTLALLLDIDEIYLHCPASLRRSGVWEPETWSAPG